MYDVIVIGGGLSGLTAASLLAKRQLKVAIVDKSANPGGSCGIFKRGHVTFDQGSAMLYGFGEHGFNAHRFVFNCLEEPIDMIRHDLLYCVHFKGRQIRFWADVDRFADELSEIFPSERQNIHRFYHDMMTLYRHVMMESPSYTTADETDGRTALKSMLRHPVSYIRFLGYLNKSARSLLERYFKDPEIFKFFDKLTSTYCYATVEEAPAVLAAVMFVDNHIGGSYYPAGSTLFLPGKLEKVIEENGGDMLTGREVVSITFERGKPSGVILDDGRELRSKYLIYSGTIWNLYGKLIAPEQSTERRREWARKQVPTYPSVVLYTVVDRGVITEGTSPVEMLVGNPDIIDESEVTVYTFSIDDRTLCGEDEHTVIAIGPTFQKWENLDQATYQRQKQVEQDRLVAVLEKRFPGFGQAVRLAEVATPRTIERYTMKNGGAVAGPKQMLGQHMFRRLHTRIEWDNLFCCGESTVMGTGTPTVTTSGLSAANALLKKLGQAPFAYRADMPNHVRIVPHPFTSDQLYETIAEPARSFMRAAMRCRFCEHPSCTNGNGNGKNGHISSPVAKSAANDNTRNDNGRSDIPGIMRRVAVGNFAGAKKCWQKAPADQEKLIQFEQKCIWTREGESPVAIRDIISHLMEDQA